MYGHILVPTDGSEGTDRVVAHAAELAKIHDATLEAVYVVNTASFANLPMETSWEGVSTMLRDEGEAALDEAEAVADIRVERRMLEGNPAREVVRYAKDSDADLIVIGTHGRGGLNRILLGSVAERVVRSSPVPVLTVRVGKAPDPEDDGQ